MRSILFSLGFILNVLLATAQDHAALTISTTGNSNLRAVVNDNKYALQDRSVTIQNLKPGNYNISIYQLQHVGRADETYEQVFNATVQLNAGRHKEIAVLRFGKTVTDESSLVEDEWSGGSYINPSYSDNDHYGNGPVTDADFKKLKATVAESYFDDDKVTNAKIVLKNNLLTADQVAQLCKLLVYDDSKIALAKYAYDYCYDKGNFILIKSVFTFAGTQDEFMEFLKNK